MTPSTQLQSSTPYVFKLWLSAFTITLSSFYFGFNVSVLNTCRNSVAAALAWGADEEFYVTLFSAAFPLGAIASAPFAGPVASRLGRRLTLCYIGIIGIGVSLLHMFPNTYIFGTARLLAGVVAGFMTAVPPLFLNEISPRSMSGRTGVLVQLQITLGIVVAEMLALPLPTHDYEESDWNGLWKYVFGAPAVVLGVQIALFFTVLKFDSPFWLVNNGRRGEARLFYRFLYPDSSAEAEFQSAHSEEIELKTSQSAESMGFTDPSFTYFAFFTHRKFRRMLHMSLILQVLQQWSGINAMFSYSSSMFPLGVMESRMYSLVLAVVNMFATLGSVYAVDRSGRRPLLIAGTLGCSVCLLASGGTALYQQNGMSLVLLLIFIISFELSLGPLVWVYCGEVLYDEAMSVAIVINWLCYFLVMLLFPQLQRLGIHWCFWLFGVILALGTVYLYFSLTETKGRTKQENQHMLLSE